MSSDIEKYCRECVVCQCSKLPAPQKAPMSSIPISQLWKMIAMVVLEMIAMVVLEVRVSYVSE